MRKVLFIMAALALTACTIPTETTERVPDASFTCGDSTARGDFQGSGTRC